jgi:hypothetical protein
MELKKSKFPLSLKVAIPVLVLMLISVFVLANNAGGQPMATLSFTSAFTSENIDYIFLAIVNPTTNMTSYVTLVPSNMSAGVSVPANSRLTEIIEDSNQTASRFGPAFEPYLDSWANLTIVNPAGVTLYFLNTLINSAMPYNSSDSPLLLYPDAGYYNADASYYRTEAGWIGNFTLTTGTWVIYLTTYTQ